MAFVKQNEFVVLGVQASEAIVELVAWKFWINTEVLIYKSAKVLRRIQIMRSVVMITFDKLKHEGMREWGLT